jgi:hypothetical protein
MEELVITGSRWLLILFSAAMFAQTAPQLSKEDEEKEWVKIRELKALYEEVVAANQVEKLRPYVASDFHGVLVNGREVRSFDDMLKGNQEIRELIGEGGSYKVSLTYEPGTMFGNVAVAHGTSEEVVVTGSGKRFEFRSHWLVNLIKEGDTWKLFRIQASMDPVDNVFVHDTVKYTRIFFGGGALIAGVLLGYAFRSRRR